MQNAKYNTEIQYQNTMVTLHPNLKMIVRAFQQLLLKIESEKKIDLDFLKNQI